jgi:hypothetical protein
MSSNEKRVTPAGADELDRARTSENDSDDGETLQNVTECYTNGGVGDGLSVLQFRALDMLLLGKTDSAIAEALGVSRMTLWRWQTNDEPFMAELARRRRLVWHNTADRFRRVLGKAVDVLEDDLNGFGASRAAYAVLQMCSRFEPPPADVQPGRRETPVEAIPPIDA